MRSIVLFLVSLSLAVVAFSLTWVQFRPDLYGNFPPIDTGLLALGLVQAWLAVGLWWLGTKLLGALHRTMRRRAYVSSDRRRRGIAGDFL